jgi:ABC-2 type transport system ATP-binding protein
MIEVKNLSKDYGKVAAVQGVSFNVARGEIYGLLGPNGAGKSTTINIISGLLRATAGEVSVGGFDIERQPLKAKRILGVVPQQSVVIEELSATQNCMFFGSLYGIDPGKLKARADELLKWIGLADRAKEPVKGYSGGMMRRLTLVLGILHEPEALVLDEPTVGLDPQTRILIQESIREVADGGTAVLLSTHYLDEAERLCGRIGIIDEGKIIREGTLHELRQAVEDVQLFSLRGQFDRGPLGALVDSIDGGSILYEDDEEMIVSLPSNSSDAPRLLEKAASLEHIKEVAIKPPSLESLFIRLTGKEIRE